MSRGHAAMDEHRHAARVEDARFMLAHGATLDEAARRTGMTRSGLEKALEKARKKEMA